MNDVTAIEKINLIPLALMVLALGIAPGIIMKGIAPSVDHLLMQVGHHDPFDMETLP